MPTHEYIELEATHDESAPQYTDLDPTFDESQAEQDRKAADAASRKTRPAASKEK